MPELPEIAARAREMQSVLPGWRIERIEVLQPKCLNIPPEEFESSLSGAVIQEIHSRGKWLQVKTSRGWLLLNLGMGGEILLTRRDSLPEKYRLVFDLCRPAEPEASESPSACLSVNFWWFGYAHYAPLDELEQHTLTARLGPNALDLSEAEFQALLAGQRAGVKSFLLDQSRLAGIGNFYIHDILFLARLHPLRKLDSLRPEEVAGLYQSVQAGLRPSLEQGGASYELDLFGQKGGYQMQSLRVGYRAGEPCPACGTQIVKIKTGSTSSFICPECQKP
jgi:formamidopyrimidine-DNA glycosylase